MTTAIFDRRRRRPRRDRAARAFHAHGFLRTIMVDGIMERLAAVTRSFDDALDLGCFDASLPPPAGGRIARCDAGYAFAAAAGGVQADEDRLPFRDGAFDLVMSAGVLDQVDDLPGALTLIRRTLRPDGLFLAAFIGGGSLPALRAAWREAERDHPAPRLHPQIDVRAAGDLLVRAGFALPVADIETVEVRYRDLDRLVADLRGAAMTSLLTAAPATDRDTWQRLRRAFTDQAVGGKVTERFHLVFCTGWTPDPSQPRPAPRGSAKQSLAAALRTPG